jgi:hypothetical protein
MDILKSDPDIHTVIMTAYWAGPQIDHVAYVTVEQLGTPQSLQTSNANLGRGLQQTITELRAANKKVIVLEDVPVFTFDPVRRMISEYIPLRDYIGRHLFRPNARTGMALKQETYADEQRNAAEIVRSFAAENIASVFDPTSNLCTADSCEFFDQAPLYGDKQHVTRAGARRAITGLSLP